MGNCWAINAFNICTLKSSTYIVNKSLVYEVFASRLKVADQAFFFKNGDPLFVENYSPISLFSSFSKSRKLVSFLNSNIIVKTNKDFKKQNLLPLPSSVL